MIGRLKSEKENTNRKIESMFCPQKDSTWKYFFRTINSKGKSQSVLERTNVMAQTCLQGVHFGLDLWNIPLNSPHRIAGENTVLSVLWRWERVMILWSTIVSNKCRAILNRGISKQLILGHPHPSMKEIWKVSSNILNWKLRRNSDRKRVLQVHDNQNILLKMSDHSDKL